MSPALSGLEVSLWRATSVFRVLALAYALVVNLLDLPEVAGPGWLGVVLAGMVAWTAVTSYAYARPALRRAPLLVADLVVTVAAVLATRLVESADRIVGGEQTVPIVWSAVVVVAWALRWGTAAGVGAGAVVGAADVVERGGASATTVHNIVLLLLLGIVAGYVATVAGRAERAYTEGVRLQAATAERERMGREIHDGVLQVLALMQRWGREAGGEAGRLGRLAGEQEVALRSLVTSGLGEARPDGLVDVRELLGRAASGPSVHLAVPATPVLLPHRQAEELAAAVAAALHNVRVHVGPGADAWVLLEDEPGSVDGAGTVVATVRDDGPGIPAGRLAEAVGEGRLGMSRSVLGRVRDIGGTAAVLTAPGEGTEVELRVPRPGPGRRPGRRTRR